MEVSLIEVHAMQTALPDQMINIIIEELDERNMGNGSFNLSRIIQSIQKSNTKLKKSLLHHLCGSSNTTNTE